jgi:hypothetical protein
MIDVFATTISVLALAVSSTTAWLTLLRQGAVRMTQPTVIYFGPDHPRRPDHGGAPKVYLRTLLYSTAKRGRVVEGMHLTLSRNEVRQTFNVWVHGDERLVRGSGLFVGETGVAANHHFLGPSDGSPFLFLEGEYLLEVFARVVGVRTPSKLFAQRLVVSLEMATALREPKAGLYFDWGADSGRYLSHIATKEPDPNPEVLAQALGLISSKDRDLNVFAPKS